uniref:Uncharacterized protein n=1 Tax=Anguilla anguilla TaxID=7936 RepID=A0A0E9XGD1_ANGAN
MNCRLISVCGTSSVLVMGRTASASGSGLTSKWIRICASAK